MKDRFLIEEIFGKDDLIFDIGAHVGSKTDNFLRKGTTVVCIEPQPDCVQELHRKYKDNPRVIIVEKGLDAQPGRINLAICSAAPTISTFSEEWKTGRFAEYNWDQTVQVDVITLDEIIGKYGLPKYCKIDVEGFEYQVLQGLHTRIPFLSFEFTIEFITNAKECVHYLKGLGYDQFNIALGEDDNFQFSQWVDSEQIFSFIENLNDKSAWGDIYAMSNKNDENNKSIISNASLSKEPPKLSLETNILDQFQSLGLWSHGSPLKLHLGCGQNHFDGYINIDYPLSEHTVQSTSKADVFSDITQLNFPDQSIDEIRLHHVFEHFDRPTALALLCQWNKWLKIGGKLTIETPDFKASISLMQSDTFSYQEKQVVLRHLFGSHEANWAFHHDGWYEEKFRRVLDTLGFDNLSFEFGQWKMTHNIIVHAIKTHITDQDILYSEAGKLLRDSMVDNSEGEEQLWQVWLKKLDLQNKESNK